jgi:hypothetical protein
LVFPLSGHDFGVGAGDLDASKQASLVVGLDNVTAVDLAGTNTAVVWTLGAREATPRPAEWPAFAVEKSVFLLETEPDLVLLVGLQHDFGVVAEIVGVGLAVRHPALAHDEDVVAQTHWVRVEGFGAEVDIRIVARSLAGGGTVKVPFWELLDFADLLRESLGSESALPFRDAVLGSGKKIVSCSKD